MLTYIKIFVDCLDSIEPLDDAERGRLFTALLEYARTGEIPVLQGNERFLFPMLRAQLDRDAAAYEAMCGANRRNGAKGGRPAKKPAGFLETEKSQEEDKDKDKDKYKEKEKEEEKEKTGGAASGFFDAAPVDDPARLRRIEERRKEMIRELLGGTGQDRPERPLSQNFHGL